MVEHWIASVALPLHANVYPSPKGELGLSFLMIVLRYCEGHRRA